MSNLMYADLINSSLSNLLSDAFLRFARSPEDLIQVGDSFAGSGIKVAWPLADFSPIRLA